MKATSVLSLVALLFLTGAGLVYLGANVLDIDPRRSYNQLTIELASSGGLMDTSEVTLRGMSIGKVERIEVTQNGLRATVEVDASVDIPADTLVRIANLSAAGEQYLDFRPRTSSGPYLTDGATIADADVQIAPTVSETLTKADALAAEIDPTALSGVVGTLDTAIDGREGDIDNVVEVLRLLSSTLDDEKESIARLYYNLQVLGENGFGYGPKLTDMVPEIDQGSAGLTHLIDSYRNYSYAGETVWDGELGQLVPHLDKYLSQLTPDLAFIAVLLKPVTAPLKGLRFDAGSMVDLLGAVFPQGGPARVAVTVPN